MVVAIRDEIETDRIVMSVIGDLDLATAPEVRSTLHRIARSGRPVLMDLSSCTFVDSIGAGVVIGGARRCAAGFAVRAPEQIAALFVAMGVDRIVVVEPA